ncbi:transposase [Myroides odoratimimus]|nr:transposase [Myroides odoratimimus]MDM1327930.1 transposase [Myroides odoratimimus]MDM1478672.1 transposase [Myroides odoratimimus]MDM1490999.1 transposase [Myroides odoratimimus]MDM1499565.1 transposase [Myroides odoratimimus]
MDYCIVIGFNKPEKALDTYKIRWQIETLFKAFKSSGFNIEDTHLKKIDRIEKLLMLVMIAFVWCYKIGDYIDTIKPISQSRIMAIGLLVYLNLDLTTYQDYYSLKMDTTL